MQSLRTLNAARYCRNCCLTQSRPSKSNGCPSLQTRRGLQDGRISSRQFVKVRTWEQRSCYSTASTVPTVPNPWPLLFLGTGLLAYNIWDYNESLPSELHPETFTDFVIVDKQDVSSTATILTLRPEVEYEKDPYSTWWQRGLWSVEFKQPQLQIARAYTPLPPPASDDKDWRQGDLRFLIRKEQGGEMSNYLHRREIGDMIEVRGPHLEYEIPSSITEVVFLAGGTGVAPALQAAHTLLASRQVEGKVHILWANRRKEETAAVANGKNVLVREVEALQKQYSGRLHVDYFVDEDAKYIRPQDVARLVAKPRALQRKSGRLIAVSGPDGFISYFAGPKVWEDGEHKQGPLGGILRRIDCEDSEVVKI